MYYLTKIKGKWDKQSQEILDNAKDGTWKFDNSKRRSSSQNSYFYGVIIPLITDWWNEHKKENTPLLTHNDIHDWIQQKGYWGYKQVGKELVPKRSSETTTLEMATGINKLQIDYAKWGLDIPSPNETDYRLGYEETT